MFRSLILGFVLAAALASPAVAGGKDSGTLVVTNESPNQVGLVVDPPAAWAAWTAPYTAAQQAQFKARATVVNAAPAVQAAKVKKGDHTLLAVNLNTLAVQMQQFKIVKKQVTAVKVNP